MAPTYKLISEFTESEDPESISVSPYWCMAVVRFAQPLTFSRTKLIAGLSDVNYDANAEMLIRERSMLVLSDDVLQMSISHSKGSYVGQLQATLANGPLNYLSEIQPNDWVLAWIVNDETRGQEILKKIKDQKACNSFTDGLKFVGRVQSIRKRVVQDPGGMRTVKYSLQACSFKELDSSVFYDQNLSRNYQSLGQFLLDLGISLDEVFTDAGKSAQGVSTTKIIPRLLRLLIGEGVPETSANFGLVQIATGLTSTKEAPYAYAIPKSVAKLLGQTQESKQVQAYADILELILGVQKYSNASAATANTAASLFTPDGSQFGSSNHRILNNNLLGTFAPLPMALSNKSVWSVLEEFKNPAVNEMYTTLRINPEGKVMPTLVVRQLPFSTSFFMESGGPADTLTGMLELPRWYVHPILVNSLDIGKSDATHVNFIHVYGQANSDSSINMTEQIVNNPPIRDEQDIKRSGLRPHMQTVNCSIADTLEEPKKWMQLLADFVIGQQYTLNGQLEMIGISAPICPGDNLEIDDSVYHIEAVSHMCQIEQGQKRFSTSVSLTHGIRSDTPKAGAVSVQKTSVGDRDPLRTNPEMLIYSGFQTEDNLGFDPGQSIDSRNGEQALQDTKFLYDRYDGDITGGNS